jgi:hypothetical protein
MPEIANDGTAQGERQRALWIRRCGEGARHGSSEVAEAVMPRKTCFE